MYCLLECGCTACRTPCLLVMPALRCLPLHAWSGSPVTLTHITHKAACVPACCRYEGLTSPYIYPLYGLGELPQVGGCSLGGWAEGLRLVAVCCEMAAHRSLRLFFCWILSLLS